MTMRTWTHAELATAEAALRPEFRDVRPAVTGSADWSDVRRRVPGAQTRPGRRLAALALAASLGVLAVAALAQADGVLSVLGIQSRSETNPAIDPRVAPFAEGDRLYGLGGSPIVLARPVADQPWDTAVLSPDRSTLVYESAVDPASAQRAGSALRLLDLATGADSELEPETYAPVWSAGGRLAYGRTVPNSTGGDVGANLPSRIEVRASSQAAPVVWTRGVGAYLPVRWAGPELLVEKISDDARTTVWAYTGPDAARSLGTGWVVAVSPDGRRALLSDGRPDGSAATSLRVVDVATGTITASLAVSPATTATGTGDWRGGDLIVPVASGLVRLSASPDSLALAGVEQFARSARFSGAETREARFAPADPGSILILANVVPAGGGEMLAAALTCRLGDLTCEIGGKATARQPLALVVPASG